MQLVCFANSSLKDQKSNPEVLPLSRSNKISICRGPNRDTRTYSTSNMKARLLMQSGEGGSSYNLLISKYQVPCTQGRMYMYTHD